MKTSEITEKSAEELVSMKQDLLREQFNLRMQKGTGQLSKSHRLGAVRKDIARIETVLTAKQAGEAK